MLLLTDFGKIYSIDTLTDPVVVKYNWVFNGPQLDFFTSPLLYLEETTGAALKIRVNGSEFWVPATWYILVTDRETYQIDTVTIQSCATNNHLAFNFTPEELRLRTLDITVIDYSDHMALVHPMIAKGTALVHPVGPTNASGKEIQLSIVIGPHDLYKYMNSKVVGDIFSW